MDLWDDETWDVLSARQVQLARDAGALTVLPLALATRARRPPARRRVGRGRVADRGGWRRSSRRRGATLAPYGALVLAAWRGREAEASELIEASTTRSWPAGEGLGLYRHRVGERGALQRPRPATRTRCAAAQQACEYPHDPGCSHWSLPELIEAAARSGEARARRRRPRAALGDDPRQRHRLGAGDRGALASAAQRRRGRRAPLPRGDRAARPHPHPRASSPAPTSSTANGCAARTGGSTRASSCARAHEMFIDDGRRGVRRARRAASCSATGETARKRTADTRDQLTAQETQIARACARRPLEPRDRRAAVHQPADRRVPPAQGVHEARHQLAQRAPAGAPERSSRSTAGLADSRAGRAPRDFVPRTREPTRAPLDANSCPHGARSVHNVSSWTASAEQEE